jgi:hypothetical protein
MILARLDNEVFFKKVFTDEIVFKAFVKDIVGIDVQPDKIETEKAFQPKLGNINFKYDIFAEDSKQRVIIEIQKVEYDHNFDRFLHYHLQAITEQQRSSTDYGVERTVYTIVVITAPYKINPKTREIYKDDVLISSLNPKNLRGLERTIFNHKLIFLNPSYTDSNTTANYRDWLELIGESIHHSQNPTINTQNAGVKRAAGIITYENISPEEWEESKIEVSKKITIQVEREQELFKVALRGIRQGIDDEIIISLTGLTKEIINDLRKLSDDDVATILKPLADE